MLIGNRLRAIREAKKLSQGDMENRSGLKRSYILLETGAPWARRLLSKRKQKP